MTDAHCQWHKNYCGHACEDCVIALEKRMKDIQLAWQRIDEWTNVNACPDGHPLRLMQQAVIGKENFASQEKKL